MIWGFGDGSTLTAVESPYGRIGSVICWRLHADVADGDVREERRAVLRTDRR